jgi:chromosomal replication initiation ATPase DnaA
MQSAFDFSNITDKYETKNFIIHEGNRRAFEFVSSSFLLEGNIYLLTGAKSSGKTYICNLWQKFSGAIFLSPSNLENLEGEKFILEDLESLNLQEEELLFLLNRITEKNAKLLITSLDFVRDFSFTLPDLQSRFRNIYNIVLGSLTEDIKKEIILKMFLDKQINIKERELDFIAKNISGNYNKIANFITKVEQFLFFGGGKLNLEQLKELMGQ